MSHALREADTATVTKANGTEHLVKLAHVISSYTSDLTSHQLAAATTLIVRFFDQLRLTVVPSDLLELSEGIALLAGKTRSDGAFAALVFGALKYPLAPREPLVHAVRSRFVNAPGAEGGFWALIDWARQSFPGLDLTAAHDSDTIATALCAELLN
jgi:hypothetical protein